jgi:hypothetical protein
MKLYYVRDVDKLPDTSGTPLVEYVWRSEWRYPTQDRRK